MAKATPAPLSLISQAGLGKPPAKTDAERARDYRARKAGKLPPVPAKAPPKRAEALPVAEAPAEILPPAPALSRRPRVASVALALAGLGLGAVGITINGWFARSLGATDAAGWLFLAIGFCSDVAALALPSVAGQLWQHRERVTALAAWSLWTAAFAFAVTASVGFASVNVTDVTQARAGRVTVAVASARDALADASAARDRECKTGTGRICRTREDAVAVRRAAMDTAMAAVAQDRDPQTLAAVHLVTWASLGTIRPSENDFAMLRLALLALLPQLGGLLLLCGRR